MNEQGSGQRRRLPPIAIAGIVLAVFCGIALYIRIALPYHQVFVNDWVWFRETDAYWHIRNIETLVHNFPHFNTFDPYIRYPGGGGGVVRPFFDWIVAGVALLVGRGAPSLHAIEVVAAYMPPILGTLTLIPVYFIGKLLFNRWVGVISAALLVILPGEFMNRSLLSFADHHAAEALLSTVSMLFLIMAIKRAREREVSPRHILGRDWSVIAKPLVYALLAGVFLGIYLLSWQGGALFVFLVVAYLLIQFIVDHLRHKPTGYLWFVSTPLFLIAFVMLLPVLGSGSLDAIYRIGMLVAIAVPIVLGLMSQLMTGKAVKPVYYPLTLLGLAVIGLVALHAINPSLLETVLQQFGIFAPAGVELAVSEMWPLLFPGGSFTLRIAWFGFTTSFFISLISFAMLIYFAIKEKSDDKSLFLVWSIIMVVAVLGQRRFGYYYAVNAALLTGYFSWRMLDVAGLSKLQVKSQEVVGIVRKWRRKERKIGQRTKSKAFMLAGGVRVRVIAVGIAIFFLVFFPNFSVARALANIPSVTVDEQWYTSLLWLKDNSPEPFDDPDFYYELYPSSDEFQYPETVYGVMSWWDYGYIIMQIAHRIPNTHPGQTGAAEVAQFFTAQNESSAQEILRRYDFRSKYVMIDYAMASPAKFTVMAEFAGRSEDEFYGYYYVPTSSGGEWTYQFYPAYYESIAVRLYNFDGKAVVPTESIVISYEEQLASDGERYKVLTDWQSLPSYEDAEAYIASQASGNHRIVGMGPFDSPVPLDELSNYKLAHQSEVTGTVGEQTVAALKVFEYLGSGNS